VHYMSEEHLLVFLIQVLVLLSTAKILGELCQRRGIPALAGEIFTGIVLGPTILGRVWPGLHGRLFPADLVQQSMLETVSWFGVLFLLLATGFEVNISTVWKQGKACLTIGVVGVVIPFLIGCGVFWWFPDKYWGANAGQLTFTLFLSMAAAISAISIIARILHDLEILKSDFGLTTLTAFAVNDLLGWMGFALVLGLAMPEKETGPDIARAFFEVILFGTVCLTVGSAIVGGITRKLQQSSLPQPGATLAFICCLGLLCGALTQWMGIHAVLGFFLAGIMAGNAPEISERTRDIISQMIHAIFVPIFFATIGIKLDFLDNFDILITVAVTAVAIGGKFLGAWAGALLAKLPRQEAFSTGIAFIPGGAMEIILGILALELKLINENVFVAVVFAALSSSIAVGPLLAWSIRRRGIVDVGGLLLRDAICLNLKGKTRWDVIAELCAQAAKAVPALDAQELARVVRAREEIMGTGLEKGVAVPHARLKGLDGPVVAFGRSRLGVDWNASDGKPAHFVFLILTPEDEAGMQIQILAQIARVMSHRETPDKVLAAQDEEEVFALLNQALRLEELIPSTQPA